MPHPDSSGVHLGGSRWEKLTSMGGIDDSVFREYESSLPQYSLKNVHEEKVVRKHRVSFVSLCRHHELAIVSIPLVGKDPVN